MSPLTLIWARVPQSLAESNGIRIMTQFRFELPRSSVAWNDFTADLGAAFTRSNLRGTSQYSDLILLVAVAQQPAPGSIYVALASSVGQANTVTMNLGTSAWIGAPG